MAKKRAPGGGRKSKDPAEKQSEFIVSKVTPAERLIVLAKAKAAGKSLSSWIRDLALRAKR